MTYPAPVAILAGGLATRLRPITERIPKALVSVAGRPFLAHQLDSLRAQGIQKVVLCVGFLGEMIRNEFGAGAATGIHIDYSVDGDTLLGTAGAIRQALPLLGDAFFVLYGDSYLTIDFAAVWRRFLQSGKPALMTVFRNHDQWDTSNVWFEESQIRQYSKTDRRPEMLYIDYGLSVFKASAFAGQQQRDLADLMSSLAAQGNLAGYEAEKRFYEIGSHTGLAELENHLTKRL